MCFLLARIDICLVCCVNIENTVWYLNSSLLCAVRCQEWISVNLYDLMTMNNDVVQHVKFNNKHSQSHLTW